MMSKLPNKIKQYIENQIPILDTIGESQSKVYFYENMVLKISKNQIESKREYQALKLLKGTLPVPKVIAYVDTKKYVYLLMEKVNGKPLFQYPLDIASLGIAFITRRAIAGAPAVLGSQGPCGHETPGRKRVHRCVRTFGFWFKRHKPSKVCIPLSTPFPHI